MARRQPAGNHFQCFFLLIVTLSVMAYPAGGQERVIMTGEDHPLQLELEDLYSVGVLDGEEWEVFSRVTALAFDEGNNLYILDRGNYRIVKVDPAGHFLLEMGAEGGGPGEFGSPRGTVVTHDGTVAVFDSRRRSFTLFHPDGTVKGTVPLAADVRSTPGSRMLFHPSGGVISEGSIVARAGERVEFGTTNSASPPLAYHSLMDGSYKHVYEGWSPSQTSLRGTRQSSQNTSTSGRGNLLAFGPRLHFGILPDGALAVVDSVAYEVKVLELGGAFRNVLSRPIPPRAVTSKDREAEITRRLASLENGAGTGPGLSMSGSGSGVRVTRGRSPQMEERIRAMEFADEIPVVKGLAVDPLGRIWVERTGDRLGEAGPIDLLTPEGRYIGSLDPGIMRIPDAFGPDGIIAFIEQDELGVPRVEVKRVNGIG